MSADAEARRRAREAVETDTSRSPAERETCFRTAEDRDELDVYTAERGLMRRLLAHPEASIDWVSVATGDVGGESLPLAEHDGRPVIGVKATLPVGVLTVARDARKYGTHADMITKRVLAQTDGGTVDDTSGGDDTPPTARDVAQVLEADVDGERLARFADAHPDPSAAHILGAFAADPEHEQLVAEWLEAHKHRRERRRARRRDRRGGGR